jgi:hypothetical protein
MPFFYLPTNSYLQINGEQIELIHQGKVVMSMTAEDALSNAADLIEAARIIESKRRPTDEDIAQGHADAADPLLVMELEYAEKKALAAILKGDCQPIEIYDDEAFPGWGSNKHCLIFRRMCDLQRQGKTIDRITVANELMKHGELQESGGLSYLVELSQ